MSNIGAMRARVKLQSPTRVADELGGAAIYWVDEGDVWAEVEASGGDESAAFDTAVSRARYDVTINRREGVRAGWRVAWGARRLKIAAVADEGAARVRLVCEEETL